MTAPRADDSRPIRTDEVTVAHRNRFITVFDNAVTFLRSGKPGTHVRIVEGDGHPGVAALALCAGRIALVRVFRYPVDQWEWGIPRGGAHGADPEVSIREELDEELGAEPESTERLIRIHPNTGLLAGVTQLFVAYYATEQYEPRDRDEVAEIRWESPARVREEILAGDLTDAFTVAAVGAAALRGTVTF